MVVILPKPERRPRRYDRSAKKAALAEAMLSAGKHLLSRDGFGLGTTPLTFKRVFEHLHEEHGMEVNPGSVYNRLWDDINQFRLDVLAKIATEHNREAEWEVTSGVVQGILENADLTTQESRFSTLRQLARLGAAANAKQFQQSDDWPLWTSIWSQYVLDNGRTRAPEVEDVGDALAHTHLANTAMFSGFYEQIFELVELETSEGLLGDHPDAVKLLAQLAGALGEGVAIFQRLNPVDSPETIMVTNPVDGVEEEWDLYSLGFYALLQGLFPHRPS